MEKLIWQPVLNQGAEFSVYLDQEFARRMIKSPASEQMRRRMNELANEDLKRFSIGWREPYLFHEGSAFISQFYIGRNGVWLSIDDNSIKQLQGDSVLTNPVEYHSHNVDMREESYVLMYLFDKWIRYADILSEK